MPETTHRIFFSYARSDAPFVLSVANGLRKLGLPVWVDQLDIPKGARWDDEVEKALKAKKRGGNRQTEPTATAPHLDSTEARQSAPRIQSPEAAGESGLRLSAEPRSG
jgi:hypothetical protein